MPNLVPEGVEIEPMLLIPFIENAFKHGLTTKKPCEIAISIKTEDHFINLEVTNSMTPKKAQLKNAAGIGMANTRQRLEIAYPAKYELEIKKDEKLYQVKLSINLEK